MGRAEQFHVRDLALDGMFGPVSNFYGITHGGDGCSYFFFKEMTIYIPVVE